jgi:hypothetical protein
VGSFVLLVTWLVAGQPPNSYQTNFNSLESRIAARDAVLAEGRRLKIEFEQRIIAHAQALREPPAAFLVGQQPPAVTAVCSSLGAALFPKPSLDQAAQGLRTVRSVRLCLGPVVDLSDHRFGHADIHQRQRLSPPDAAIRYPRANAANEASSRLNQRIGKLARSGRLKANARFARFVPHAMRTGHRPLNLATSGVLLAREE